jgi:hypothetical protein
MNKIKTLRRFHGGEEGVAKSHNLKECKIKDVAAKTLFLHS